MKMLHSIKTLILLASVPAMAFIPGRMLEAFEAVGAGTSATVYKATYAGATVALKRLSASFNKSQKVVYESMIAEIQLLTQLRHPNVVNFLGICYNSKSLSKDQNDDVEMNSLQIDLVMDFYPLCLKDFLYVVFELFHISLTHSTHEFEREARECQLSLSHGISLESRSNAHSNITKYLTRARTQVRSILHRTCSF